MDSRIYAALFSAMAVSCGQQYALPSPPNLPNSVTEISTAGDAQEWLKSALTYKTDLELYHQEDFWAPCALTYQLKAGDCEDFAICAAALLDQDVDQGYIIFVDNERVKELAHAVFAYQINNQWGIISNMRSEFRLPAYPDLLSALKDSVGGLYHRYMVGDYYGVDIFNGNEDLEPKINVIEEGPL